MSRLPSVAVMERAFAEKDPAFEGTFVVAVKTTGVFCRPVCRAKPARRENLEFFPTAADAARHGYRPCKLCRPTEPPRPSELVERLIGLIDRRAPDRLVERDLLDAGIDPSTARRQFRAFCGMTFAQYQRRKRVGAAVREAGEGGRRVIDAQTAAGFESASGFRDALARLFAPAPDAQPPSRPPTARGFATAGFATAGAATTTLLFARWIPTPLGTMLAVARDEGLVLLDFVDGKGVARSIDAVRQRASSDDGAAAAAAAASAAIVPADHPHLETIERELGEYFAGTRRAFTVPLRPHGTPFERRAWDYMSAIPYAQTRTYGQEARGIGDPRAVRAVGRANGRNPIALVIPCHRVIGATGTLTGYGGGLARKRWLLDHEQRVAGTGLFPR